MHIKKWSQREIEFLKKNYIRLSIKQITEKLNRSYKSIQGKAGLLGIRKFSRKISAKWTSEEIKVLENNIGVGIKKFEKLLPGRTREAIKIKRHKLGLTYKDIPHYTSDGYKQFFLKRENGRTIYQKEHRKILENNIGRKLNSTEQVHHIDCDKTNNDKNNLYLCRDRKHHMAIHRQIEKLLPELIKRNIVRFDNGVYRLCQKK